MNKTTLNSQKEKHSMLSLRRATIVRRNLLRCISIHALLAESDGALLSPCFLGRVFLSTLSLRRATHIGRGCVMIHRISIHALLAESDHDARCYVKGDIKFLSTLSLRRATFVMPFFAVFGAISIHALLAESDAFARFRMAALSLFLSTLSLRRATSRGSSSIAASRFLSTLSLRRATVQLAVRANAAGISIHALLAESDLYNPTISL